MRRLEIILDLTGGRTWPRALSSRTLMKTTDVFRLMHIPTSIKRLGTILLVCGCCGTALGGNLHIRLWNMTGRNAGQWGNGNATNVMTVIHPGYQGGTYDGPAAGEYKLYEIYTQ